MTNDLRRTSDSRFFFYSARRFPFLRADMTAPAVSAIPRVAIGGTIAIDHVKTPDSEGRDLLGGSAAYAALAASFFTQPVGLIGIIGHDFPAAHLEMLEARGVSLDGVERSENESFTWSGEYHENMNERTTHTVGLNVLENWSVSVPKNFAAAPVAVLANMSPDNQLEMLAHMEAGRNPGSYFVIADTMDLWISIASERLHEVLPKLDLFVLNEGEARELAGTSNLIRAGAALLAKGPRHVIIKLGEFGAMLFSAADGTPEFFRCSAYPLDAVADPTGAGDTFLGAIAGYLAAHGIAPYNHQILRQAIIRGTIVASFTCEAFSTRRLESLTNNELEERLGVFRAGTHW